MMAAIFLVAVKTESCVNGKFFRSLPFILEISRQGFVFTAMFFISIYFTAVIFVMGQIVSRLVKRIFPVCQAADQGMGPQFPGFIQIKIFCLARIKRLYSFPIPRISLLFRHGQPRIISVGTAVAVFFDICISCMDMKPVFIIIIKNIVHTPFFCTHISEKITRCKIYTFPVGVNNAAIENALSGSILNQSEGMLITVFMIRMKVGISQRLVIIEMIGQLGMVTFRSPCFLSAASQNDPAAAVNR